MGTTPNLERARTLLSTASQLVALAHDLEEEATGHSGSSVAHFEPNDAMIVELARQIYHARRRRSVIESCRGLFGEPAWDILLELFIAARENRDVSVSGACSASGVPTSTALRSIAVLQERGLIMRDHDPQDGRRSFVRISSAGLAELNRYFRMIADAHKAFAGLRPSEGLRDPLPTTGVTE